MGSQGCRYPEYQLCNLSDGQESFHLPNVILTSRVAGCGVIFIVVRKVDRVRVDGVGPDFRGW